MVILTIERLLLTIYPIKAKLRLTPKVSSLVSLTIVLLILIFTSPNLFFYRYLGSNIENSSNFSACVFVTTPEISTIYKNAYKHFILIFYNLLPMFIIMTGNALIGTTLLKRKRLMLLTVSAREKMAVKMLFAISILNIIFSSPYSIYGVAKIHFTPTLSEKEEAVDQLVLAICHMLIFCNFTFNFFLYFARGSQFRKECKVIFSSFKSRCLNQT